MGRNSNDIFLILHTLNTEKVWEWFYNAEILGIPVSGWGWFGEGLSGGLKNTHK